MNQPLKPLTGVRVIELARILAGPWCGQVLADLGADVIKVEAPQGDDTRGWGPPFYTDEAGHETAGYFASTNRGKRSVVCDLSDDAERQALLDLVSEADILIENFKVGGLTKYGLDEASLRKLNPELIYCSITGFGQSGPYASRAGYDFIVQGMSGLMHITGEPDGAPQKVGVAISDILTGLYAAIGILSELVGRQKLGQGRHIDLSLLDAQVCTLANQAANLFAGGSAPTRLGNHHPNIVPYQVFETADLPIVVAVGNDRQFRSFCATLGMEELGANARFSSNAQRVENRSELTNLLADACALKSSESLLAALAVAGVPAGPVNTLDKVFDDEHVKARRLVVGEGAKRSLRLPILFDGERMVATSPPPSLGPRIMERRVGWTTTVSSEHAVTEPKKFNNKETV